MAHEETADCCGQLGRKFCKILFSARTRRTEIEFCKNFGRVLPRQGLAAKAGGRLYERHKREWFGATEGAKTVMAARSGATDIGRVPFERSTTIPVDILPRPFTAASSA
ncbi:hypothetical protein [Mesorhizobium sp. M1A.F.Ca.IN.022.07.1.1]|uniref:hypothetical protein n=1 Tax=Mesorhizobium sp. M1A.F.Ca.IN.022.07.1.1 TaxID=2496767 RepID=UPI0013E0AFDE|nr:hypothetical protein [Mesorhizobium sp. M1A.F.Ca.IN.022.07.1.1]